MQKLRVKRIKLRIEMDKTQGQISENSGSKLKNSGFGISPNLVKFSRTAQKKPAIFYASQPFFAQAEMKRVVHTKKGWYCVFSISVCN